VCAALLGVFLDRTDSVRAVSTTVVISEFRTRGPNGAADEFVEPFDASSSPVNIGGWKVNGSNNAAGTTTRFTIGANTTLNPGCFFLATNSSASGGPYSGPVPGNITFATGITDDGGIAPTNGNGDGNTSPDWLPVDGHRVQVRSERAGGGSGRIYTITVTCADAFGNSSSRTTTVAVPK
jgi:hypothetical protein